MTNNLQPFHLAIVVHDINLARKFYGELLGMQEGRSCDQWIDWDFFGHQLVTHLNIHKNLNESTENHVDGHGVPVPHFGVVLEWNDWHKFADKLKSNNIKFVIEPYIRFKGLAGEQATMFFKDPSNNSLEFKAFKDISKLFTKQ
jgi:extradiol dioxygenase family protein